MSVVYIHGAEARLSDREHMGRPAVAKERVTKSYRHKVLDDRLRAERTRDEANLLIHARKAGVAVPVVFDIDRGGTTLVMERIAGQALRDVLPDDPDDAAAARLHALGGLTARMHAAELTHGDLTTSNVLVTDEADPQSLVIIDFGLGQFTNEDEQRGVDLHLVEEALEATDARAEALVAAFLDGYAQGCKAAGGDAHGAMQRLEGIRLRGRYREAT